MNLRQEWMTNNDLFGNDYAKNLQTQEAKDRFDIQRYQSNEGFADKIDGVDEQTVVQIHVSPYSEDKDLIKICCRMECDIKTGSLVEHEGKTFIVVSKINNNSAYKYANIHESNNTLKFYDQNSILYEVPCIVGDKVQIKTEETKYITTVSNELYLTLPHTTITEQINVNDVYKIGLHSYKIESLPDDVYIKGLLVFKLAYSEVEQVIPVFSVQILNGNILSTNTTTPIQLNVQTLKDNVVLSPTLPLTYSSSNTLVATVSSSGLVTPLITGSVNISVKLTSDATVSDSITITVVEVPQNNYTVEISGSVSIIKGSSSTYNCVFKNNGIAITDSSVFYLTADDGISATSLASITSQNGVANSCIVKGDNLGYVKLWVKNVSETVVSSGFRIQIKNIF